MSKDFEKLLESAKQGAREDLLGFCYYMNPNMVLAPHHRLIADKLMDSFEGLCPRLMVFLSPRSSKSWLSSIHYPAWCIGQVPSWQFMVISHSLDLAADWSREVRNIVDSEAYQELFPGVRLSKDSKAANKWNTNKGGVYVAAGAGGRIAGRGANLAILDDPISEQDAYSRAEKARIHRWYPGGLRSRLMNNGRIVLMTTRWAVDDLSGWLLEKENEGGEKWEIVNIPAILDEESAMKLNVAREEMIEQGLLRDDYPILKEGETYWPRLPEYEGVKEIGLSGWTTGELLTTKANMPAQEWSAVYQQKPVADKGNIIKITDWQVWDQKDPPKCEYVLISFDTAYTTKEEGDYSAYTVWGIFYNEFSDTPNLILLGADRGRWDFPTLRRMAMDKYNEIMPDAVLVEKKASGMSLIQDLRLAGVPTLEFDPEKDKIARAHATTPYFNAKLVWVPKGKAWTDDVIMECASFPAGAHDDYVDTVTQAIIWVRNGQWVKHPDDLWQDNEEYVKMRKRKYYY